MKESKPYTAFGELLAQARRQAGYQNQNDLALLLDVKQQSVSRWEAGMSRPRADQIPEVAKALKLDPAQLREAAGYASSAIMVSFDHPFPVDQVAPETFERLVEFVVERYFKGTARVQRAGSSGHKQDGLDVKAILSDGKIHTFQCKRQRQFGPAEAKKAIAAHSAKADKKYLVLSRVASPQTAAVLEEAGWELWDKNRLSQIIRGHLTQDEQDRLVDIYFPGKRFELLGRSEPSPWQDLEQFFAPFEVNTRVFSHTLELHGRQKEIKDLIASLEKPDMPLVLLTGAGGIGKSRILKEALNKYSSLHPDVIVRLLSVAREARTEDLEKLGTGPKLLVVDDAHDRDGLGSLLHYAAQPEKQTRLLFATRLYAEARLRRDAATVSIEKPDTVRLERLSRTDSIKLAKAVLAEYKVLPDFAESIVDHVGDNPLVTVMAARVIAAEGIPLEAAKNAQVIRDTVLGKFKNVVIGNLGNSSGDAQIIKDMLDVLALIQPFHIQDAALMDLLQNLRGIDSDNAMRLLRILQEGGLIYQRRNRYRLMPDLLGDYLIEESCIGPDKKLTRFAERAFDMVHDKNLENMLVNLGRMDWRLSDGDPAKSPLLDSLWRKLRDIKEKYDTRLKAISAVAIYQPRQALAFVEHHIREGSDIADLPKILRSIASDINYTEGACEALWELSKNQGREDGYRFESSINILKKLCGFQENKSLKFCKKVFDFAMKLSKDDTQWMFRHPPLEIMLPVLSTEEMSTEFHARSMSFRPLLINHDIVKPLRQELISHMLGLLGHADVRIARKAAAAMDQALRAPTGMMNQAIPESVFKQYYAEFENTINAINEQVRSGRIQPVILLTLAYHMSWMSKHAAPGLRQAAEAFIKLLPRSLEFRLLMTLEKGNGAVLTGGEYESGWQERDATWVRGLCAELKERYSYSELLEVIENGLKILHDSGATHISAHTLINSLIGGDLGLARIFIDTERRCRSVHLQWHLAPAVSEILKAVPGEGRLIVDQFLDSIDESKAWAAAASFRGIQRPMDENDYALLKRALSSPNSSVVKAALHSLWGLHFDEDPRRLIGLAKAVHFENDARLAEDLFMLLVGKKGTIAALTRDDAEHFLVRFQSLPQIEGYHCQDFLAYLSETFPLELINFFLARIDIATKKESYSFHPVNFGPYSHVPLRFSKSEYAPVMLARVWEWACGYGDQENYVFKEHISNLFEAIFPQQDGADLAEFFDAKIDTATAPELKLMARILRNARYDLVFKQKNFVVRFLDRCNAEDSKLTKLAVDSFYTCGSSGMRSGVVGEPFQRDLHQRDEAQKALENLPHFSPAFKLYDYLYHSAERDIAGSPWELGQGEDE